MPRKTEEWIGKTDDTPIPPRVRVRVFAKYDGICQLTGRKIRPGDSYQIDHIIALINGGENRENNLWPVLTAPHKVKTKKDLAIKSKIARVKAKHLGQHKPKGRPMDGTKASGLRKRMDGTVERRVT